MQLRYFATVREYTGENERLWLSPAADLQHLLQDLSVRYGRVFAGAVISGNDLSPTIIILVNGRDVRHLGGLKTPLAPNDIVSIFPMVAGG
jgi:sulfur-carrier protein